MSSVSADGDSDGGDEAEGEADTKERADETRKNEIAIFFKLRVYEDPILFNSRMKPSSSITVARLDNLYKSLMSDVATSF